LLFKLLKKTHKHLRKIVMKH